MSKEALAPTSQDVFSKLTISAERHLYIDKVVQANLIETQPVLITEMYSQELIPLLAQAALNGKIGMYILCPDPNNAKAVLYLKLSPHDVYKIWVSKPHEVAITVKLYSGEVRIIKISVSGLIADKIEADEFLGVAKPLLLEYTIKPLTTQQVIERKKQIQSMSLEMRALYIQARGKEIFLELYGKYKDKTFKKDYVAELMLNEESQIYTSLNKTPPQMTSYLKHIRSFKPERSKQK